MKIGVIADDFTGASDIALTLAEAGARVAQFIGVPGETYAQDVDAGVVALKSRTAPVDEAVKDSLQACDWLMAQGAKQIVFKVCSTFDSTPKGNIGPVLDALADRIQARQVIVCPAFPENGRSVYMGHLFVNDCLLSESGMQDHPLTPMTDADLRRVLGAQSQRGIAHVTIGDVLQGAAHIGQTLPEEGHVIVDAIRDADLIEIGRAAGGVRLLCGGSGIAMGLPQNFGIQKTQPGWQGISGPGVVLSGSCSRATRAQVEAFKVSAPSREITAADAVEGHVSAQELADWVLGQESAPLIYSSADPEVVKAAQARFGLERSAGAIETLFSEVAAVLAGQDIRRIVVAGGETSGAVVKGLQAQNLQVGPRLAAGVPVLRFEGQNPIALALKSGNFGGPEFFSQALQRMESST